MGYSLNSGFFVGDSVISYNWFGPINSYQCELQNHSTGGKGVVGGLTPNITESFNTNWPLRKSNTSFVILQGGVNDIKSFSILPDAIKTAFQLLLDDAIADVGASNVYVQNIAPWKNHSAWTSTYQGYTDTMNAWFLAQSIAQGFVLVDINSELAGIDPDELLAEYDSGDGIHPSQAGVDAQNALYDSIFLANNTFTLVDRMNITKLWRGAVQPASISASGNEFKAWRGAVQPAAVTSTSRPSSKGIGIGIGCGI